MNNNFEDFRSKMNDNPEIMEAIFNNRINNDNIVDMVSAMPRIMFDMLEQYHLWLNQSEDEN